MKTVWKKVKLIKRKMISVDTLSITFVGESITPHIPGQFYLIKMITKDQSNVSREYSIANAPNLTNTIEFGIQKIPSGAVSTFLHTLKKGQEIEVKGPLGKYFNWNTQLTGPCIFIAGGSGIVPFMSIIRALPKNKLTLIASFKTLAHFSYFDEITGIAKILDLTFIPTLTRETGKMWGGRSGRIDSQLLKSVVDNLPTGAQFFVCGRSVFVEDMTNILEALGIETQNIQRERFG